MRHAADVVIIGGGIVGCAAAYYLARRGITPVLLERSHVAAQQSGRSFGFVRQQGRDPLELPLAMESNRLWQGLAAELETDVGWVQTARLYERDADPVPNLARIRAGLEELRRLVPGLDALAVEQSWAGYIEVTPDALPVLGEAETPRGLVVATGFCGRGFALGPVAGRLVAELVTEGRTSLDLRAFRPSRFREGALARARRPV